MQTKRLMEDMFSMGVQKHSTNDSSRDIVCKQCTEEWGRIIGDTFKKHHV